jgi:hypothetical protein
MKYLTLLLFLLQAFPVLAQQVNITVADRITRKPITSAIVKSGNNVTYTNMQGACYVKSTVDTALISYMGYKPYYLAYNSKTSTDTIRVYLEQVSILLKDVKIGATRNFKTDSLKSRQMFSSVYNFKAPEVMDAFTQKASLAYVPSNNINALNNTTSIMSINVLQVISLLTKNNNTITKLQKTMVKDEEGGYINRRFSKQKVAAITALKGDSLQNFMLKYRPSIVEIKTMTDYDLMIYIKKHYTEFSQVR